MEKVREGFVGVARLDGQLAEARSVPVAHDSPGPGGARLPAINAQSRTRDGKGSARAGSNCILLTSETVGVAEAGSAPLSNYDGEPTICKRWFKPTA
jgi:hypothetical protein